MYICIRTRTPNKPSRREVVPLQTQDYAIYIAILFGLFIVVLFYRGLMSAVKDNARRTNDSWSVFFDMFSSFVNLSVLPTSKYLDTLANAHQSYLELAQAELNYEDTCPEPLVRQLLKNPVLVKDHHVVIRFEDQDKVLILSGKIQAEALLVHDDQTIQQALSKIRHVSKTHRTEVMRHRFTSQVALKMQTQLLMVWRAVAGYKHDMAGLAVPFFTELKELILEKEVVRSLPDHEYLGDIIDRLESYYPPLYSFIRDVDEIIIELTREEKIVVETLDLSAIFRSLFQYWVEEQDDIRPDVSISVQIPEGTLVSASEVGIFQAIWNPLKNAVRYTPTGEIKIYVRNGEDGYTHLVIQDTGMGIPESELKHIGQFGYRSESVKETSPGEGIGLWITQRMMEKMSGKFSIESSPSNGTRVILGFQKGEED